MLNNATLAAILLICAGIIHNYSFMCRKLKPTELKTIYPATTFGKLLLDGSWMLLALAGLLLTYKLSPVLAAVAVGIYFLLLPFILQPPLARLLGVRSLSDYVEHIDNSSRQLQPGQQKRTYPDDQT